MAAIRLVVQPDDSDLCGQAAVATAAGVSLSKAIEVFGHKKATRTKDLVVALRALGIACNDKLQRISRSKPLLPKRCIVSIARYGEDNKRAPMGHWMLSWDGVMYDPANSWPNGYKNWRITSVLEILS